MKVQFNLARRWLLLGALVALTAGLVACEDDGDESPLADATVEDGENGDVQLPTDPIEITVGDGGLDPNVEQVRVPDRYQLIVHNESSEDCEFYLGTFVQALDVPAGETAQMDVQLPPAASGEAAPGAEEEMDMGCAGDEERQGRLVVRTGTGSDLGVQ